MSSVVLVEVEVTSPAGATSTLRFADRAIRPLPPTDALRPNVGFESRLAEAPAIQRLLFEDLTSLQPSIGVGAMSLLNADRFLNQYEGHAWGEVAVYLWEEGSPFSTAIPILKGLAETPAFPVASDQGDKVQVSLYDYRAELVKPLQADLYAGTNGVAGELYQGVADGLKGRPIPLAYGNLLDAHIPGAQVNAGLMAYQLHDGQAQGAEQLFDRGDAAGYVDEGDYAGAAFDVVNPAAAHYRTDLRRGLLKLNGDPVGQLTFGVMGDAPGGAYVETIGPILARILAKVGVPAGRIGASVAALASTAVVGAYAGDVINADEFAAWVAASAPALLLPDRLGVWQAIPLGPPAAEADAELAETDIIDMVSDEAAPLPVAEVRVGWGRIWTTFSGTQLAPALVNTDAQERLASEYRWAVASDPATKARRPSTWGTVEIPTALRFEADATALAAALINLFALRPDGRPRRQWRVTVELDKALALTLGKTLFVPYARKGVAQNFLFIGEELMRPRRGQAILTVWG